MRVLLLVMVMVASVAKADYEVRSKSYFKEKVREFKKLNQKFEESYKKEVELLTEIRLELAHTLYEENKVVEIYQPKGTESSLGDIFNCDFGTDLTECLYGSYEKFVFIVKSDNGKLVSVGSSFLLPKGSKRYKNYNMVEKEIFIFRGNGKKNAILANW